MEPINDAWEHLIVTLQADATKYAQFLQSIWPGAEFPIYAPQALIPELNAIGRDGWELVSIQPIIRGENGDLLITGNAPLGYRPWTYEYLCTFKRRLPRE